MHIVPALALLTKMKKYFRCKFFTCLSSASFLSSSTLPCHLNVPRHREGGLDCMPTTVIRWLGVEANSLLDNLIIPPTNPNVLLVEFSRNRVRWF